MTIASVPPATPQRCWRLLLKFTRQREFQQPEERGALRAVLLMRRSSISSVARLSNSALRLPLSHTGTRILSLLACRFCDIMMMGAADLRSPTVAGTPISWDISRKRRAALNCFYDAAPPPVAGRAGNRGAGQTEHRFEHHHLRRTAMLPLGAPIYHLMATLTPYQKIG
jgi:hypothetical protein